jgi:hypothetical protein
MARYLSREKILVRRPDHAAPAVSGAFLLAGAAAFRAPAVAEFALDHFFAVANIAVYCSLTSTPDTRFLMHRQPPGNLFY